MIPIAVFALTMFFGLWISGYQTLEGGVTFFSIEGFRLCFGEADPMPVCVWASILSTLAALAISKTVSYTHLVSWSIKISQM